MYKPFKNVIFRFPQFSFTIFKRYLSNDSTSLVDIYSSKEFQEAIYIASPSLYEEVQKYLAGYIKEEEKSKIEYALFRYFSRMSTRCTLFGTFAGVASGKIKQDTTLHLAAKKEKHTRLDMFFLCSLFQYLMSIPEIKKRTIYYANSTIYEVNNKYRYIEYYYTNNNRKHQIVEIKKDYFCHWY